MTSSRSRTASVLALVASLVVTAGVAHAGGRKRIVVLAFDGPKAERFHDDLVRLIKRSHTVISTDKWNGVAEDLGADKVNEKNVKKIARKLKVDGVVIGKIEKRRDEYIIRLKLREGKTGELVGDGVETTADGPHLTGEATRDIKDELLGAIEDLETNRGGGGDDDDADAKPKKTAKKKSVASDDDDDADVKPKRTAKKKAASSDDDDDADVKPKRTAKKKSTASGDDDDAPKHRAFVKHSPMDDDGERKPRKSSDDDADARPKKAAKKSSDDDDDIPAALKTKNGDDDAPKKSAKRASDDDSDDDAPKKSKKKKVAKRGDDDDESATAGVEVAPPTGAAALSPINRAIDGSVGASFTARKLSFNSASTLGNPPPSYSEGLPLAGVVVDVTLYPFALGHKRAARDILNSFGFAVVFDRVLFINSAKTYLNTASPAVSETAKLGTTEQRYALGPVFRYALGDKLIGAKLLYEHQDFQINQQLPSDAAAGQTVDIPNVSYNAFTPSVFAAIPVAPKITLDGDAGLMIVLGAGSGAYELDNSMEYGRSTKFGFELAAGADYQLAPAVFVRAQLRVEDISIKFVADPTTMANNRDPSNSGTQSVFGASDLYYGAQVTIGYLF